MYLTKEEEEMYDGEYGPLYEWAMKFLSAYGDALGAERLLKISAACIDDLHDIDWQLPPDAYEQFTKTRMAIPTYTACLPDTERWRESGMSEELHYKILYFEKQAKDMGIALTASCAPYLVGWTPFKGTHVATIESALYVYINSVFGARTHCESYPGIYAVAVTGKTPYVGLHTDEGRKGNLLVDVRKKLTKPIEYEALGYYVGAFTTDWDIPVFTGKLENLRVEQLKSLGAALQMNGSVGLYHIVKKTPEAPTIGAAFGGDKPKETISVGDREIEETCDNLCTWGPQEIEHVILGCPHYTVEQLGRVADLLRGAKIHKDVTFTVLVPRAVRYMARQMGILDMIEGAGGIVLSGCWAWGARQLPKKATIATDSAKCAYLAKNIWGQHHQERDIWFGSPDECVSAAINGRWK